MKGRVKDRGILIKASPYSESSLILQAFTRERGLIAILAKGIRKKPEASLLAPLNDYELTLYEPSEGGLYLMAEFALSTEYALSGNVEAWTAAECAVELYSQLVINPEESPRYYDLLREFLAYLPRVERNAILIWWRFLLRIFSLLGIPLDTRVCGLCASSGCLMSCWEKGRMTLHCHSCGEKITDPDRFETLSPQSSRILYLLPEIGLHLGEFKLESSTVAQLNQLFRDYFYAQFNNSLKLKGLQVLEQLYR